MVGVFSNFLHFFDFPLCISTSFRQTDRPRQTGVNSFTPHLASILPWIGPVAGGAGDGNSPIGIPILFIYYLVIYCI